MRASVLILVILSMAILGGCKKYFVYNHFITYGERGDFYTSTCEMRSGGNYPIGEEKALSAQNQGWRKGFDIYNKKGKFYGCKSFGWSRRHPPYRKLWR